MAPGERKRLLEDQLGDVGQAVTDLHQRQASRQVQHRDPEHRGPAEVAQCVDAQFLVGPGVLQARREFLGELRPIGQRLEDARVEQFVEQERMCGDLPCQVVAHAAGLHQPLERLGVLVEEREIGGTPADRLDDAHEPREHGQARPRAPASTARDGVEDARQERGEASPAEFVEPAGSRPTAGARATRAPRLRVRRVPRAGRLP